MNFFLAEKACTQFCASRICIEPLCPLLMITHFIKVATEIISQLDVLVEGGKGDEQYKELFQEM